jgi:hypothetical protein
MMKKTLILACLFLNGVIQAQQKKCDKTTLEKTYDYTEIHKSLRDLVDESGKAAYFNDDYFNGLLKKIVSDRSFTESEKAQMFFLMQKKIGFAFVGAEYIPPKENYYTYHSGKIYTYQKTKLSLKPLNYNVASLLKVVELNLGKDAIVAGNALLLATLLNTDSVIHRVEEYSKHEAIMLSVKPDIFNHYVCLAASIVQDSVVVKNLINNLKAFTSAEFKEDVLCALYSRNNPVSLIREYILTESSPTNSLTVQTALCVLAAKLPPASFQKNVKRLSVETKDKWKADLCKNALANKNPFNYALSSSDQLVTKKWEGVTLTQYADGSLITNGAMVEFDPN